MALCGPKLSLFGVIISAWGIVQLVSAGRVGGLFATTVPTSSLLQALMGVFFYLKSPAFIEDLPLEEEYSSELDLKNDIETGFEQVASSEQLF